MYADIVNKQVVHFLQLIGKLTYCKLRLTYVKYRYCTCTYNKLNFFFAASTTTANSSISNTSNKNTANNNNNATIISNINKSFKKHLTKSISSAMKSLTWLESQKHNYDYNDNNDKYV